MNRVSTARDQARRRRRKVSFFGILALMAMGAFIYWLAPHSHREVHTVDGQYGWTEDAAPPQRGIIWQPAKPVETKTTQADSEDSRIRPQLTDDGTTLYFTRRKADGSKDIYRRRLVDSTWQEAEPVAELNTLADDIGPVITPDGKTLYLYSDRVGGQGGLDLYVSQETSDGWSEPRNLGERINSPAHEYDAAVSSDGRKLFFASNRSEKMHRQLREGKFDEDGKHWKTTLRADLGRNTFDLYMARREKASQEWDHAQPLASLNQVKTNEGAPYVSPNDTFVYFSSDRNVRPDEETNFDIFRARIRGNSVGEPENLGIGVNTAANEHEPSLSPEGFRLYFSRNRIEDEDHPADDSQYDLYTSLAAEVEDTTYWDDGNVKALAPLITFLLDNLWWIITALLFTALLAALRYFLQRVSWRRAPIPGFLLAAILLHLLLAGGSFYVVFKPQIDDVIEDIKEKVIVASRPQDEDPFDEIEPPKQPFEEVADIKTPDTVVPSDVPKQVTETPNLPTPINTKVPTVEMRVSPDAVPTKVTPTQQPETPQPIQDLALPRQRTEQTDTQETIKLEQAQSQNIVEQRIEQQQVNVNPRELTPTQTDAPVMQRRPVTTPLEFAQEQIPVEKVPTDQPEATLSEAQPDIKRSTQPNLQQTPAPTVNIENLTDVAPQPDTPNPEGVKVDLAQQTTLPQTRLPKMQTLPTRRQPALNLTADSTPIEKVSENSQAPSVTEVAQSIVRTTATQPTPETPNQEIRQETISGPAPSPTAERAPQSAAVGVNKQTPVNSPATPTALPRRTTQSQLTLGASEPQVEKVPTQPIESKVGSENGPVARRTAVHGPSSENTQINTEVLAAVTPNVVTPSPKGVTDVKAERQQAAAPTIQTRLPSDFARTPQKAIGPASDDQIAKIDVTQTEAPAGGTNNIENLPTKRESVMTKQTTETPIETATLNAPLSPNTTKSIGPRSQKVEATRLASAAPAPTSGTLKLPSRAPSNVSGGPSASEQSFERVPVIPGIQSSELSEKIERIRTELANTQGDTATVRIETTGQSIPTSAPAQSQPKGVVVNQSRQRTDAVTPGTPSLNVPFAKTGASRLPRATHNTPPRETSAATEPIDSPSNIGDTPTRRRSLEIASLPAGEIQIEEAASGAITEVQGKSIEGGQQVGATRAASTPVDFQIASSDSFAGPTTNRSNPVIGRLARELIDSPITFRPLAGRNTLARAPRISNIPDDDQSIRLLATLSLRKADARAKEKLLEKYKGDPRTLPAIQDGLIWINQHQFEDGHWSLHEFDKMCKNHDGKKCRGKGLPSDTAATGLALLPFLGDGQTHLEGRYKDTIRKGLQWLVKNQVRDGNPKKDGDLFVAKNKNNDNARMYSHGIATIALCEAYALSKDETLRDPAQRAINFIVHSQHKGTGGWRYQPNQPADTSVVGWQVMALKSGQMADLVVPQETLDGVKGWFQKIAGKGKDTGKYGYQSGYSVTMTAEALLCMEYLGADREDIEIQKGADILLQNLPKQNRESSYYWYYGTQTMFHMQGEHWERWNGAINKMLIDTQQKNGTTKGTWDPKDNWEGSGGRIYSTSLRVLMLEVYFRHLPLYKVLNP